MITIKKFVFNDFQVNCYVLYDETKECIIVDAANYNKSEDDELANYITNEGLKPVCLVNTHCHIDHILGSAFVENTYGLGITMHAAGKVFLDNAIAQANVYGFNLKGVAKVTGSLNEGDKIKFGNSELEVLYTPGHADGSICLVNHTQEFVITGDVLFQESIGRTDLPTGDYDLLKKNIITKLFTLEVTYIVYPGHGPSTSIGNEAMNNPFI
ncbi:MAG: MBL fold metallo-hydrolase [Bacteroidota bacterium]